MPGLFSSGMTMTRMDERLKALFEHAVRAAVCKAGALFRSLKPKTTPPYKGRRPRPPANPLIAVHAICEHAAAIAGLDLRETDSKWRLDFGLDSQPLLAALLECPNSASWITPFEAHLSAHSLAPISWSAPTVAPDGSPLVLIEKLRGRTLCYQNELPDSPTRKHITRHLESIQDAIDTIHFALRGHPDAKPWQHELIEYERAQRRVQPYRSLAQAVKARQAEWDPDGKISLLYCALELAGEVGELANDVKKLEREQLGLPGSRSTHKAVLDELADVHICPHLVANKLGVDLEEITRAKFNETSTRLNLSTRLLVGGAMTAVAATSTTTTVEEVKRERAEPGSVPTLDPQFGGGEGA
jgi:NTP pyrophosphatase (non-canonical NTP hydrolase)